MNECPIFNEGARKDAWYSVFFWAHFALNAT